MRIALDTNILAYLAGLHRYPADGPKIERARTIVERLSAQHQVVLASQTLGELFNILVKYRGDRAQAQSIVSDFQANYAIALVDLDAFTAAFKLAVEHRLQIWDALILSASAAADCPLLLSEDMHDGFVVRGMTIANPFADEPNATLVALLD